MAARLGEIRDIVSKLDEAPWANSLRVRELDSRAGYAFSAATYDTVENPLLTTEQPIVEAIVADVPPGDALDAACGTGRHAKHLARRHRVTGVDASPEMLAVARAAVPEATFMEGDLDDLHLGDEDFDVVVCALALCHLKELVPAVAELARVARPGAKLVLTDPHPISIATISHLFVPTDDGGLGFVRNHYRSTGEYLDAFGRAGLRVVACHEPVAGEEAVGGLGGRFVPGAMRQAIVGLPFALIWELEKRA